MLLRLGYLAVSNAFAMLRLLPMGDRDKDAEILALRHQIAVLERQLGQQRVRFNAAERALLAVLLHRLPRQTLRTLRLRPDTVLRWHRDLIASRHAVRSRPKRPGRRRTVRSIRRIRAMVLTGVQMPRMNCSPSPVLRGDACGRRR